MEKEELVSSIEGLLTALSQTFIVRKQVLFSAELVCAGQTEHIMVRHKHQLNWRQSLKLGCRYCITDLRRDVVYEEKIPILHTRSSSKVTLLENQEKDHECFQEMTRGLISYKGVVTDIIDYSLGMFELDHSVILILSYLQDITGEFYNRRTAVNLDEETLEAQEPSTEISKSATDKNEQIEEYLKVGEQVELHHIHLTRISERTYITCCGRSELVLNRMLPVQQSLSLSTSSILDVFHQYHCGLSGLLWLTKLMEDLIVNLCPDFVDERLIDRRKWHNEHSLLTNLIKCAASQKFLMKPRVRSLFREFVKHDEYCYVNKEFSSPFSVIRIADLKKGTALQDVNRDQIPDGVPSLFNYDFIHKDHNEAIIGKLVIGNSGIFKIHDKSDSIDVQIIGTNFPLLSLNGAIVTLFDYMAFSEEYNILKDGIYENLQKKYIMVKVDDIHILRNARVPSQPLPCEYDINIISKSNMIFSMPQVTEGVQHPSKNKFFFVQATVSRYCTDRKESWSGIYRFCNHLSLYYPCVQPGHIYALKIEGSENPNVCLKAKHGNLFLLSLGQYLGTTECIDIPEGATLFQKAVKQPPTNRTDLAILLGQDIKTSGLITVMGIVRERRLMTPKFASEKHSQPETFCNEQNIAIPGSKCLMVLLSDASSTVCIYFNDPPGQYISQYPIGLLPGAEVSISFLLRKVSKETGRIYLQSTNWTRFSVLSFPNHEVTISFKDFQWKRLKFASENKGPFKVIATVRYIHRVEVSCICSACNSEMVNGSCTYVGCSSLEGGKIAVSAHIWIDDGTAGATVVVNSPAHLQTILCLTDAEFLPLCEEIVSSGQKLTYIYSKSHLDVENAITNEAFAKLCSPSVLGRQLKFHCRPLSVQEESCANLFCLDVANFNPNEENL